MLVGKNILANLTIWLWPLVLTIVTTRVLLRGLGTESYGVLVLVNSVTALAGFASGGLGYAVVKHLSHDMAAGDHDSARALVGTSLALTAASAVVVIVLLNGLSNPILNGLLHVSSGLVIAAHRVVILASLNLGIGLLSNVYYSMLVALQRYGALASVQLLSSTLLAVTQVGLVWLGMGIVSVAAAGLACSVLGLALLIIRVIRLDSAMMLGLKVKRQELGRLVSFGTFRTVDMLACLMLMQIDRLVVGAYLGAASIAYYSIPQSLAQQLAHMATSMTEPLFPRLSQMLATRDHEGARNLYRRGTRLLVWFISTAVGCVIVMCDLLFRFWLGAEFAARAAPIMRWLALGWGLTAVSVVGVFALNAFGLPEINAGARILQALVLLAGCVALVPRLGAIAAAYSLAGSMLLTVPLYLVYVDYRMDLRSLEVAVDLYLKPLLIGTVVLVVGAALRQVHGRVYEVGLLVTLPALSLGLALELGIISRAEREMGRALLAQAWSALYSRGLVALLRARPSGLL